MVGRGTAARYGFDSIEACLPTARATIADIDRAWLPPSSQFRGEFISVPRYDLPVEMALRESFTTAIDGLRTHPELFVLGCAIGGLQTLLFAVVEFAITATIPIRGLTTVVPLFSVLVVLPLFVSVYELVLHPDPDEPTVASLRRAVGTAIRRYPRVLLTDATAGVASLAGGLLVGVGWYVVATGGRYVRYVAFDASAPSGFETVYLIGASVFLGTILANFAFRFSDVLTAFHDYDPVSAVTRSAIIARRYPRPLAGFVGFLLVLQFLSFGVVAGVSAFGAADLQSLPRLAAAALLLVLLNGVAVTVTGTLHAAFCAHHVTPDSPPPSAFVLRLPDSRSLVRWTVALVCVFGLVTGAATVRTLDVGVYTPPDAQRITTTNPSEAVERATVNTAWQNHRRVLFLRNASGSAGSYRVFTRTGVDYADRQVYVYFVEEDGERFGGFYGEGTMGLLRSGGEFSGPFAYQVDEWGVMMLPGTGIADAGDSTRNSIVPSGPTSGWSVVESNESVLVVRLSDPEAVPEALGTRDFGGETPPLANESHVTVVIDRERGVLDEVRMHLHSLETGRDVQYRLEYRDVGSADLRRPAPIRNRRALEHLWDAIYY
jgi:hypothetical protein